MIDITAENWPAENHAGGFSFSTAATVFFANSSVGVALSPCERCALSRIASSNGLYNFHSGIWLQLATAEFPMFDLIAPGTTLITPIPKGLSSSLHLKWAISYYQHLRHKKQRSFPCSINIENHQFLFLLFDQKKYSFGLISGSYMNHNLIYLNNYYVSNNKRTKILVLKMSIYLKQKVAEINIRLHC